MPTQTATLAGGCFWCLEAVYEQVRGVESVVSGYTGGTTPNPSYREVCSGRTGHAEAVQIAFDPDVVSYRQLLELFFTMHDPTTLNRQGPDAGTQYRSAVYHHDDEQRAVAQEVIADFAERKVWPNPIVTEVAPLGDFYEAEGYHQRYYRENPYAGYCQVVIAPKVAKLRKEHLDLLKA